MYTGITEYGLLWRYMRHSDEENALERSDGESLVRDFHQQQSLRRKFIRRDNETSNQFRTTR